MAAELDSERARRNAPVRDCTRKPVCTSVAKATALEAMQRGLEAAAARLGYAAEERASAPHLTIGRVKQNLSVSNLQKIRTVLEGSKIGEIGRAYVQAIHLFKSELNPAGSIYSKLFSAPLAQET